MKKKYNIILILLISFFSLNLFRAIKIINSNIIDKYNLRFLESEEIYDKSGRTDKKDLESIENCENSDYKYFFEYITGHNVTFSKNIDTDRAVSNCKL